MASSLIDLRAEVLRKFINFRSLSKVINAGLWFEQCFVLLDNCLENSPKNYS